MDVEFFFGLYETNPLGHIVGTVMNDGLVNGKKCERNFVFGIDL